MTDFFVCHYTEYPDLETYLRGYAVTGDRLAGLTVPSEILLADDDPVIPVADVARLAHSPALRIRRSRYGGHCGFIANYRLAAGSTITARAYSAPEARPGSVHRPGRVR